MTVASVSVRYQFAGYELHPDERQLLAGGLAIHLGPHAFDLLVVLVQRGGRLVSKDELLAQVWPKVVVEENTLQVHISSLRKALGVNAIATVSGRGYRFNLDVAEVSAATPSAPPPTRHNLPHPLTSFIGREDVLTELRNLAGGTRLLTLTGAGGCGKTRLAIEFARQRLHAYPDGVWLVELAALTDPGLLPQSVASVLSIKEQPGKSFTQTLIEYMASRSLLLVLDNAEHVLAACAQLADAMLRTSARLVILLTSRERLGIAGELTYRVPSLSVPDPQQDMTPEHVLACESARLFIERARLQRPHFAITAENARALGSICHRLDGIPLAIELAAPRVRSMSVEEVDRRLDRRFSLLTGGSQTALPRHRTLRSMIDWSYDLLSDAEKATLRRASVFAGGWTLEAAEHVCCDESVDHSEVLDLLTSLFDKNLVLAEERAGATRYGLLETVRHYARDQLGEADEETHVQGRHLMYFLALAEEAEPNLRGAQQQMWFDRLAVEHDNLRTALARCSVAASDAPAGLRLAGAVHMFWYVRGYCGEGRSWLSEMLDAAPAEQSAAARAKALGGAGRLAYGQADYPAAAELLEESIVILRDLGDRKGITTSLNGLGNVALFQGNYPAARALFAEALAIGREVDDRLGIATSLSNLGLLAILESDAPGACAFHEEGLAIWRELGDHRAIALTLSNLGLVAFDNGDDAAARAKFEECLAFVRQLGDRGSVAYALNNLGRVARSQCDYAVARAQHEESLAIYREIGDRRGAAMVLSCLAEFYMCQGDHASAWRLSKEGLAIRHELGDPSGIADSLESVGHVLGPILPSDAARIWSRAERLREEIGVPLRPRGRARYDRHVAAARAALADEPAFDLARQEGRAMTIEQAVRFALDTEFPAPIR